MLFPGFLYAPSMTRRIELISQKKHRPNTDLGEILNKRDHTVAWICLIVSGCLEVVWAFTMKLSHGFTDPVYTLITIAVLAANLFLLERPVAALGIGVSYGVFTGLGIVGTTLVGIIGLGESINIIKIASIAILMTGVIGLKYCDAKEAAQKAAQMVEAYNRTHQVNQNKAATQSAVQSNDSSHHYEEER